MVFLVLRRGGLLQPLRTNVTRVFAASFLQPFTGFYRRCTDIMPHRAFPGVAASACGPREACLNLRDLNTHVEVEC